jgi:hypothetical protein
VYDRTALFEINLIRESSHQFVNLPAPLRASMALTDFSKAFSKTRLPMVLILLIDLDHLLAHATRGVIPAVAKA